MKIIFLNVWNAKMEKEISAFLKEQAADTDLFCFQEVGGRARKLFEKILPDHRLAAAARKLADLRDGFAQATYAAKSLETGDPEVIFGQRRPRCGLALCTPVRYAGGSLDAVNLHGLAQPGAKLDDPDRLRQSRGLVDFLAKRPGPKIIGGDFNLMPETESLRMFAANGYRDLIADFKIATTRNRLAWDKYPGSKQYFSDYVFVSPEFRARSFMVPDVEISDHLPLIVDII